MDDNRKTLYLIVIVLAIVGIAAAVQIETNLSIDVQENMESGKLIIYYEPQCVEFYEDEITQNNPKEVKIYIYNVRSDYDTGSLPTESFFEAPNEQMAPFKVTDVIQRMNGFDGKIDYDSISGKSVNFGEQKEFTLYIYKDGACDPDRYLINLRIDGNLA